MDVAMSRLQKACRLCRAGGKSVTLVAISLLLSLAPGTSLERVSLAAGGSPPGQVWFEESGSPVGPLGIDDLKAAVGAGRIAADSLVWMPGMAAWLPAAQVPVVAELLASAQPPPPLPGRTTTTSAAGEFELGRMVIELGRTADGNWLLADGGGALAITNLGEPEQLLWRIIELNKPHRDYRLSVTVAAEAVGEQVTDVLGTGLMFDATQDPFTFKLLLAGPDGSISIGRYDGDGLRFPMSMKLGELRKAEVVELAVEVRGNKIGFLANGRQISSMTDSGPRGEWLGIAATGNGRFKLSDFRYEH